MTGRYPVINPNGFRDCRSFLCDPMAFYWCEDWLPSGSIIRYPSSGKPKLGDWMNSSLTILTGKAYSTPHELWTKFMHCCVLLCVVPVIIPISLRFLYGHWGNTIIPLPVQKWSKKYRVNSPSHDDIITTKQSTTNPCVYFMGYMLLYIPNNQVGYAMCCVIQTGRNRSITDSCCWRFELKLN